MLTLIPVLALSLLAAGFRRAGFGWLKSLVFATIPWSLFLVAITELLSLIHAVTRLGLVLAWLGAVALGTLWTVTAARIAARFAGFSAYSDGKDEPGLGEGEPVLKRWERWALYVVAAMLVVVALTAVFSAPNVEDAMEYHLPRVVEWMDHQGVQFYPTVDPQQLSMPPLAEYMMLHLYLLYGTDRLVNLVQWLGFLGSIFGVVLIAGELGGNRRVQAFAAVMATAVPTGLLAASGTKNDNVMTYWIVMAVYFLLVWRRDQSWLTAFAIGASGGLAAFCKGTAYTFLPPLALACWMMWNARARRRFLAFLPFFAVILVAVCGTLWTRNYRMTGSVLGLPYFAGEGPVETRMFANSHRSPKQAMAGILRNLSNDVALPSAHANLLLTRGFSKVMRSIGVDPNDVGQIWSNQNGTPRPFEVKWSYVDEIRAGNQMDLLLLLAAAWLYLANRRRMDRETGWLALGIAGSFVLFAASVRWGPWSGRYQLPVFTLSGAFVALVFSRALSRSALRWVTVAVLFCCLPLVLMNYKRPLLSPHGWSNTLFKIPRYQQYFLDYHQGEAEPFKAAAADPVLKTCRTVGLDVQNMRFEYPMMALIDSENGPHHFEYRSVNNVSAAYANPSAAPACAVVCLNCADKAAKLKQYGGNAEADKFGGVVVFSNGGKPVADAGASGW